MELRDITTLQYADKASHTNNPGPASEQTEIHVSEGYTNASALLPDSNLSMRNHIIGDNRREIYIHCK